MMEQEFNDVGEAKIIDESKVDSFTMARFTLTQLLEHEIAANLDPKEQVCDITKANDIKLESLLKANSNFCCKNIRFAATPDVSVANSSPVCEKAEMGKNDELGMEYESMEFKSLEQNEGDEVNIISPASPQNTSLYNCAQCGYESKSSLALENHSSIHKPTSERTNRCGYCPHEATSKPLLKSHVRKSHPELKNCSYITKRVSRMLVHEKPLNYRDFMEGDALKCHLCTYRTNQKRHLKLHLTLHERPSDSSETVCNKSESRCDSQEFSVSN